MERQNHPGGLQKSRLPAIAERYLPPDTCIPEFRRYANPALEAGFIQGWSQAVYEGQEAIVSRPGAAVSPGPLCGIMQMSASGPAWPLWVAGPGWPRGKDRWSPWHAERAVSNYVRVCVAAW